MDSETGDDAWCTFVVQFNEVTLSNTFFGDIGRANENGIAKGLLRPGFHGWLTVRRFVSVSSPR